MTWDLYVWHGMDVTWQHVWLGSDVTLRDRTSAQYNHPGLANLEAAPDANDLGKRTLRLGDEEMIRHAYGAALREGRLTMLPDLARRVAREEAGSLSFNEVQLRAAAKVPANLGLQPC